MTGLTRLRHHPARGFLVVIATSVLMFVAMTLTPGATPAIATPDPDAKPTLSLTGSRFSVAADRGFSATLELAGIVLPATAFEPAPPPTTAVATTDGDNPTVDNTTASNNTADTTFPTTYLVTASVYEPLDSVAKLDAFTADGSRAIDIVSIPLHLVAKPTDTGATIDLEFDGSGAARRLRPDKPGLYPIRLAVIRDGDTLATLDTYFEKLADNVTARAPLIARVVARVPDIGPSPDQQALDSTLWRARRLIQLAKSTDRPISVFVAPSAVRFLGEQHPDVLAALAKALEGEAVFPLPATYLPADAAIANDLTESFTVSVNDGRAIVAAAFPNSVIDNSITVLDSGQSQDGLALWTDHGISSAIVSAQTYIDAYGSADDFDGTVLVAGEVAGDRTLPIGVINPRMRALSQPLDEEETAASRAVEVLAFVAAVRAQAAPDLRTLLLATPTAAVPSPAIVAAIEAGSDDPSFEWASLSDLTTSTNSLFDDGRPVSIGWPTTTQPDLAARAEQVHASRLIVADALSMLPDDDERRARWPTTLDNSLSTLIDEDQALAMVDGVNAEAANLKAAVSPPEAFKFTLTGSDSTLRFQLTNNADTQLTVVVTATSDRLSAPAETTVVLPPNAVSEVALDVITRSNGTANLRILLRTPAGNPVGETVTMTGRVNTYSGLGQLFSVGALLVLTTWWVTHLRRRRRLGRAVDASVTDDASDDDTPADSSAESAADPATDSST